MFSSNTSQVADDKLFVEDCFSTYLYQGNGGTQTITNGIDLAGKGGMVWIKDRSAASSQRLYDTTRGANNAVFSNLTNAQTTVADSLTAFNSNGFTAGSANGSNGNNYASWTFRKAPKFFDVVTYTGNGASNRAISHSLASSVGMIIIKATGATDSWWVWHRSFSTNEYIFLNQTAAKASGADTFPTTPTTTDFYVGANGANVNAQPYVAYLFAHDTTSDGIIQCGSYTGNGSATGPEINLGWEAQWVLIKRATGGTASWVLVDNMRGMSVTSSNYLLYPNSTGADNGPVDWVQATATGFQIRNVTGTDFNNSGDTYIYIAIRRGPMRTPTSGTAVFAPVANVASGGGLVSTNFPVDMTIASVRSGTTYKFVQDRLRGVTTFSYGNNSGSPVFDTTSTAAEDTTAFPAVYGYDNNVGTYRGGTQIASSSNIFWNFRRAPSFFDEVCYTTSNAGPNFGADQRVNHNLTTVPELILHKPRNAALDWLVYAGSQGVSKFASLNQTTGFTSYTNIWGTAPTATDFGINVGATYGTGRTMVAYLFASCPGVSKVGSYTGNGSSQTINCGFAAGARFVMIKRTDSTGDWYVWDTARGIVSGNDPHLSLNSTAAEVTTDDSVDTDSSGFVVNQLSATNINVSSATYLYLAVA